MFDYSKLAQQMREVMRALDEIQPLTSAGITPAMLQAAREAARLSELLGPFADLDAISRGRL